MKYLSDDQVELNLNEVHDFLWNQGIGGQKLDNIYRYPGYVQKFLEANDVKRRVIKADKKDGKIICTFFPL